MRVDLIAPVRLSARPALERLVQKDLPAICRSLASATGTDVDSPRDDALGIIMDNEPTDAVLLPRFLCRGVFDPVKDLPLVPDVVIRSAEVSMTPFGLAIFRIVIEVEGHDQLLAAEAGLSSWIGRATSRLVAVYRTALADLGLLVDERAGLRGLPLDSFLWWHRVLEVFAPPSLETFTSLDRFPEHELRPGTRLRVGDGYTRIVSDSEEERTQLVEGLFAATQLWLVTDRLQRGLAEQGSRLRAASQISDRQLRAEQDQALRICEETMLESQLLLEEQRYMAGARRQALEAAGASWRMPLDLRGLFEAADIVRDVVDRRVQQRREYQADWLNRLLAALTLVTALSVVLFIFETAVGLVPEYHAARLAVAAVVALASVTGVLYILRRGRV